MRKILTRQPSLIIRRIKTVLFEKELKSCKNDKFCIISNNCLGALPYQLLKLKYNTPTVGLFFYPSCFIKFISNLDHYLGRTLHFKQESFYQEGNRNRLINNSYPLGKLDDIEIHFLHYKNEDDAMSKWQRRVARVDMDNLFFLMTESALCREEHLLKFDSLEHKKKKCFTAKNYNLNSTIQIMAYSNLDRVGDLYNNTHLLYGNFKFGKWLSD